MKGRIFLATVILKSKSSVSIEWRFSFYFVASGNGLLEADSCQKKMHVRNKICFLWQPYRACNFAQLQAETWILQHSNRACRGGRWGVENDSASGHLDRVTCTDVLYSGNKCWGRHAQLPMKVWWCAKSNTAMDYRRNRVGGCSFVFPLSSTRDCSGVYAAGRVTGAKGFWELVIKVVSNIVW